MDKRKQLLIRNIIGGVGLLALLVVVLAFFGVFESKESDEAQVRQLISDAQHEVNNHNWERLLRLTNLTPEERRQYLDAIPRQANFIRVTTIQPESFINVPSGATEYSVDVLVIAHLEVLGRQSERQRNDGTMHFVKQDGVWLIDLRRTAPAIPHLPAP
jgi:hypothetical protein